MSNLSLIDRILQTWETKDYKKLREYILKNSIELNRKDAKGITPLMLAIKYCGGLSTIDTVNLLLDMGADINSVNNKGRSTLFLAIKWGQYEVAKLLIFDSDLNIRDYRGETALMMAIKKGHIDTVNMIISNCDVNIQNNIGETALIKAVLCDHSGEIIKLLLPKADPNLKDKYGMTALMVATTHDLLEATKLLAPVTNLDIRDIDGMTALMLSCYYCDKWSSEISCLLIDYGCNIHIKDNNKYTAFDLVSRNKIKCKAYLFERMYAAFYYGNYGIKDKYGGKTYEEYYKQTKNCKLSLFGYNTRAKIVY